MIRCATGHRPDKLGGYSEKVLMNLSDLFQSWLSQQEDDQVIISGMALGWDQAVALATLHLRDQGRKFKLLCAIPCLNQESKWPSTSQSIYKKILSQADEIFYVSKKPYTPSCMQTRNCWMVDNSEEVVALWNGSSGGTANCIRYAEEKKKPIINLWEKWNDRKRVG